LCETPPKNLGEPDQCIGNPCNPATGNKYQSEIDYRSPDGTISFTRSYNSGANKDLGLGYGWSANATPYLEINSTILTVWRGDGRGEHFTKNASGAWQGEADSELILAQGATGYTLTHQDGATERYDSMGKLLSSTNRAGLTYVYGYNTQGKLATLTGPFGHALVFGYDASGHLSTFTDPAGKIYSYAYDASNNLIRVTYPDGKFRTYHYENTAYPRHLTGITDENGARLATWSYDSQGRAVTSQHAVTDNGGPQEKYTLQYDTDTQTTITDAIGNKEVMTFAVTLGMKNLTARKNLSDGRTHTQTFDANNNLTCKQDDESRVTKYAYNTANQRVSMTEGLTGACSSPVSGAAARITAYQYLSAELDLPTLIETPSVWAAGTKQTHITYDAQRNPIEITQSGYMPSGTPVSRTVKLGYNVSGQVTKLDGPRTDVNDLTTLTYYGCTTGGACGQLKNVTNALGHTTTYDAYDAAGRLLQMTDPNGIKTSYTYDARGRMLTVTVTPPGGTPRLTQYTYDAAGQVTSVTMPDGFALTYTYDAAHYLRTITDSLGNKITYTYDLKGNRVGEKTYDPQGALARSIEFTYDARNRVNEINSGGSLTRQVWDAVGNLLKTTDPNQVAAASGISTTHTYDPLNRLIETLDNLSGRTRYHYDVADRLKQMQAPNNATTEYIYDDLGNLLQEHSPDRGTTAYSHDAAGNVKTMTDARGITVTYIYDPLNRPTMLDYPGTAEDVLFTYDAAPVDSTTACTFGIGHLCQVQDESGISAYAFDAFGNVLTHQKAELSVTYVTRYGYDAADRLIGITYPDGRLVQYTRDALGRIGAVTATVNGVSTIIAANRSYRADGLLIAQGYGNGLAEARQYDLQGRLTYQSLGTADTRLYTYDPNGNFTQKQSLAEGANYRYDRLDRLTQMNRETAIDTYGYDANGNRLSDARGSYSYLSATNRLSTSPEGAITLDAAGNTLTDATGREYRYNQAGRLKEIYHNGSRVATYTYNHLGQRTRKQTAQGITLSHYDIEGHLLRETDASGATHRTYLWAEDKVLGQWTTTRDPRPLPCDHGNPGNQACATGRSTVLDKRPPMPAQTKRPGAGTGEEVFVYLHTDHLGAPRLATDAAGHKVWSWEGEAFGYTVPNEDPDQDGRLTTVNLRYPGQYFDSETGLHYNWNRYYDPGTGRYLSRDPIGLEGGLNTYIYALANPLRYYDPFGLRPLTAGEIDMLRQIFNCNVDYPKIDIHDGPGFDPRTWPPLATNNAVTLGNNIYFPSSGYKSDFSTGNLAEQSWLVHEVGHVYQGQNDPSYSWVKAAAEGTRSDTYQYDLDPSKDFGDYRYEQQAEILADYYRALIRNSQNTSDFENLIKSRGLGKQGACECQNK